MTYEEAAARATARHGARNGWEPHEIEDEIRRTFDLDRSNALEVTADAIRTVQEQQIQTEHDDIATEFAMEEDYQ